MRLLKRLLSYLPSKLPVGTAQFDKFASDIIELSGPYADVDSMRFAIASMLIHADARHGSLSKHYFVVRLRKSAANQISSQVFQDIKAKQQAAHEAAEKAKLVEDTTPQVESSDGKEKA